ncbi:MAG TPA: MogA/MoaB family molybdenum cofactor biosynthesis protein [Chondromyces sp.]|nr:MogA/MoaB family molybdenum cofactor biosynthesis protein [Chondromyces sp.]
MHEQHKRKAVKQVRCKVITVSDTRTEETDKSGKRIKELLLQEGHIVKEYAIVPDEKMLIQSSVKQGIQDDHTDAVILNGGTGIAKRDVTIEAVHPLLEKELSGFGEIFRYLSYQYDIGSGAILSRALAGVSNQTVIFTLPGSTGAVSLAMEKLVLPELGHIIMELNK